MCAQVCLTVIFGYVFAAYGFDLFGTKEIESGRLFRQLYVYDRIDTVDCGYGSGAETCEHRLTWAE
jgi:hypothetical protein